MELCLKITTLLKISLSLPKVFYSYHSHHSLLVSLPFKLYPNSFFYKTFTICLFSWLSGVEYNFFLSSKYKFCKCKFFSVQFKIMLLFIHTSKDITGPTFMVIVTMPIWGNFNIYW